MRKELADIAYTTEDGNTLNLWKMLHILQDIHKVDFWDYYNSGKDFDNWADSKGYGDIDPDGKRRGASNIWYAEWQADIKDGLWQKVSYCPFIDMFMDDIEDLGNDMSEDTYLVDFERMLERAKKLDKEEFGQDNYRVHLTSLLIEELGNEICVDQGE